MLIPMLSGMLIVLKCRRTSMRSASPVVHTIFAAYPVISHGLFSAECTKRMTHCRIIQGAFWQPVSGEMECGEWTLHPSRGFARLS